jgi:hypothetical protein
MPILGRVMYRTLLYVARRLSWGSLKLNVLATNILFVLVRDRAVEIRGLVLAGFTRLHTYLPPMACLRADGRPQPLSLAGRDPGELRR